MSLATKDGVILRRQWHIKSLLAINLGAGLLLAGLRSLAAHVSDSDVLTSILHIASLFAFMFGVAATPFLLIWAWAKSDSEKASDRRTDA